MQIFVDVRCRQNTLRGSAFFIKIQRILRIIRWGWSGGVINPHDYVIHIQDNPKNDRNGGIWQSGISTSLAEYVQHRVCLVIVQSSLHENVIFSVCARMDNAAYIIFIMWNSISGFVVWLSR